ncbi:hypothetical protein P4699_20290 [Priestia aryabhattai]|uniref:hypothetical protein n=1 Tax=Priestia aryabhattai TaxID=412384 RepID=UPI002E22D0B4|nr:hypothetical protein [Priestia aryabhattai]
MNVDVNQAMAAWTGLAEALEPAVKEIRERLRSLVKSIESLDDSEEKEQPRRSDYFDQSFFIVFDTRKPSQVICNKPRFAVRKIIR